MDSQEPWSSSYGAKSQSNDDYNIYDFDGENSMDNEEDYNSLENVVFSRGDKSKHTEMDEEILHNKFAQKLFAALHKNEDERSQNSSNEDPDEYGLSVSKKASFLQSESKMQVVNPWMDEEEDFTTYEENQEEFTATAVDMDVSDEEEDNLKIQCYEQNQSYLGLQKSRWNQKSLDLSSTKTVPYKSEIYDPFRKSYMEQNRLCVGSNNSRWGQKLLDSSNTKTVSDIYAGYATQNPQNYKPPAENQYRWDKKSLPSNNYMDPRRNFQGAPNWSANPQQNYSLHQQIRNTPQGSQMTSKNANYIDPRRNFQGTSIVLPNPQQNYNLNQQITNTPQGSQTTSKHTNLTNVELKKDRRKEAATTVPNVLVVPTIQKIQMGNNNLGGDTSGYLRNYVEQIYRCTQADKVVFDRIVQQIIRNLLFGKVTLSEVISRLDPAVRKTLLDRCPALNINTGQSTSISGSVVVLKKKKNSKKDKKNKSTPPQTVAVSVRHAASALNIKTGQSTSTSTSCSVRKKKKFYRKDKKNKGYTLTFRQSPPPQTVAESVKHSTTLVESSQVTQAAINGHTTTLPPIISPPNHLIPLPTPWFLNFMVKPKDLVQIPDKPWINPDVCAKLANKFTSVKIVDKTNLDRTFEVADVIDIEKKLTQTLDETISNPKIAIPKFYAMAYVDKCIWLSGEPEIKPWLKRNLKKWSLKALFYPEVSLVKQFYFFLPSKARHLLIDNRTKLQAVWTELAGNNPFVVEDGWMISLHLNKRLDPDLVAVECHMGSQAAVESLTNKDCCVKFCEDSVKLYPGYVPMRAKEFAQQHPDVPIQRIAK